VLNQTEPELQTENVEVEVEVEVGVLRARGVGGGEGKVDLRLLGGEIHERKEYGALFPGLVWDVSNTFNVEVLITEVSITIGGLHLEDTLLHPRYRGLHHPSRTPQ
jgi:hypothetical protein